MARARRAARPMSRSRRQDRRRRRRSSAPARARSTPAAAGRRRASSTSTPTMTARRPGIRASRPRLAWRHHGGDRQLRRRLRAGAAEDSATADQPDGRRRGHSRHGADARACTGTGKLPRLSRCAGRSAARHRCRAPSCRTARCASSSWASAAPTSEVPRREDELAQMRALSTEALRAGALGFSTSRTLKHKARDGRSPRRSAPREAELLAHRARHEGRRHGRACSSISDFDDPRRVRDARRGWPRLAGRPFSCPAGAGDAQPERWRGCSARSTACAHEGAAANAQVGSRPIGVLHGLRDHVASRSDRPSCAARSRKLPLRRAPGAPAPIPTLRAPPDRADARRRRRAPTWRESFAQACSRSAIRPDYEPGRRDSIAAHRRSARAARRRRWRSTR